MYVADGEDGAAFDQAGRVEVAEEGLPATGRPLTWTLSVGSQRRMLNQLSCILSDTPARNTGWEAKWTGKEAADLRRWLASYFGAAAKATSCPDTASDPDITPRKH